MKTFRSLVITALVLVGAFAAADASARPHRPGFPFPFPPPQFSACQGMIQGTWGFKGGRPMTVAVYAGYGNSVTVQISQANGTETVPGVCAPGFGGAQLSFQGTFNFGNVTIYPNGQVQGMVSNFSFVGFRR